MGTSRITKLEFLPAFKAAYEVSISKENILASFKAGGLVPHTPEAVLSKLSITQPTTQPTRSTRSMRRA
jgi:hypothetical protein